MSIRTNQPSLRDSFFMYLSSWLAPFTEFVMTLSSMICRVLDNRTPTSMNPIPDSSSLKTKPEFFSWNIPFKKISNRLCASPSGLERKEPAFLLSQKVLTARASTASLYDNNSWLMLRRVFRLKTFRSSSMPPGKLSRLSEEFFFQIGGREVSGGSY